MSSHAERLHPSCKRADAWTCIHTYIRTRTHTYSHNLASALSQDTRSAGLVFQQRQLPEVVPLCSTHTDQVCGEILLRNACMDACMHLRVRTCMHSCVCIHVCACMYACMCLHVCTCTYSCIHLHASNEVRPPQRAICKGQVCLKH